MVYLLGNTQELQRFWSSLGTQRIGFVHSVLITWWSPWACGQQGEDKHLTTCQCRDIRKEVDKGSTPDVPCFQWMANYIGSPGGTWGSSAAISHHCFQGWTVVEGQMYITAPGPFIRGPFIRCWNGRWVNLESSCVDQGLSTPRQRVNRAVPEIIIRRKWVATLVKHVLLSWGLRYYEASCFLRVVEFKAGLVLGIEVLRIPWNQSRSSRKSTKITPVPLIKQLFSRMFIIIIITKQHIVSIDLNSEMCILILYVGLHQ